MRHVYTTAHVCMGQAPQFWVTHPKRLVAAAMPSHELVVRNLGAWVGGNCFLGGQRGNTNGFTGTTGPGTHLLCHQLKQAHSGISWVPCDIHVYSSFRLVRLGVGVHAGACMHHTGNRADSAWFVAGT